MTLKNYLLGFCTEDADILDDQENRRYWRCQAEDYDHAVEQLRDAEPYMNWCELVDVAPDRDFALRDALLDIARS